MYRRLGIAVVLLCGFAARANAITLYSQAPDFATGLLSDFDPGWIGSSVEAADGFMIGSSATATTVTWYGGYDFGGTDIPPVDDFVVNFYADDGFGTPGVLLMPFAVGNSVSRTLVGSTLGLDTFEYTAAISMPLLASTDYHLSIVNNTDGPENSDWFWGSSPWIDGFYYRAFGTWGPYAGFDLAFTLEGGDVPAVPEPSTCLIMGLGALGAGLLRRRRKSS